MEKTTEKAKLTKEQVEKLRSDKADKHLNGKIINKSMHHG